MHPEVSGPDETRRLVRAFGEAGGSVDHYLASLRRWAARLRLIAGVWDSPDFDPRERQAFPIEWGNIIRLAKVEALAARGALRPAARNELRQVADELAELLPTMRRPGVSLPDLEALERARRVEAA